MRTSQNFCFSSKSSSKRNPEYCMVLLIYNRKPRGRNHYQETEDRGFCSEKRGRDGGSILPRFIYLYLRLNVIPPLPALLLRKAFIQSTDLDKPSSVFWAKERAPRQLEQVKSPSNMVRDIFLFTVGSGRPERTSCKTSVKLVENVR